MIAAVPGATPFTLPDERPTVAIKVLLLAHVPPVVVLVNSVACPAHTVIAPVMPDGKGFVVTTLVAEQPVGKV